MATECAILMSIYIANYHWACISTVNVMSIAKSMFMSFDIAVNLTVSGLYAIVCFMCYTKLL